MPGDVVFATKPALARQMIGRALDAGTPAAWVAADGTGQDPRLRAELARRGLGYVLAVAKSHRHHRDRAAPGDQPGPAAAPPGLAAAVGRTGPRWYDWALIEVTDRPSPKVPGRGC